MAQGSMNPHSQENEMAVLGSMMLNQAMAVEIMATLRSTDFYQPKHATIFEAIGKVISDGNAYDSIMVLGALGDNAQRIGGAPYLAECQEACPNVLSGPHYAQFVAEDSIRRRVIEAGAKIQLDASQRDIDVPGLIDRTEQTVLAATKFADRRESPTDIATVGAEALAELRKRVENGEDPGIPTGLRDYDRLVTHRRGQMIIVGGRPGMGKSTFTQQIALHAARTGYRTVMITLEMPRHDMVYRMASDLAAINSLKLDRANLDQEELARLDAEADLWKEWPLDIVDWCRTFPAIRSYLRRYVSRLGGIDLFVVDFLTNIEQTETDTKAENQNIRVGRWADGLKSLALELNAVAIVAAQLKRLDEDKIPGMSDLRDSGNIEQSADVVALLHRHEYYNPDKEPGTAKIVVAKHRRGPTKVIRVGSQLHFSRFTDLADEPPPRQQNRQRPRQESQ